MIGATATVILVWALAPAPVACLHVGPDTIGKKRFSAPPCNVIEDKRASLYIARLETSMGTIIITLDPVLAPESVNNFLFLARTGFYDGLQFHRVENASDHALVQTGDPTGTGRGGPGYTYAGSTPSPITRYARGVVAMANTGTPASNGSQFFVIVRDYEALGPPQTMPRYTFFGYVDDPSSLRVLDAMVQVPVDGTRPVTPVTITKVTVTEVARHLPASPSPSP